ncbi:MAG TPA: ankyrin repeat domain-containing protein [Tepidisphaeraceae bacterium]|jgi:ankyrin repeat protein|nr:ankyrin repeat domain-containing protein [Tepidisphaeraceae bacterium]
MSKSLPPRPNLEYLKKSAKQRLKKLRANNPLAKLTSAQLEVAREYGFASWRKLHDHILSQHPAITSASNLREKIAAFLDAAVSPIGSNPEAGNLDQADAILHETPELATADLLIAAALGNAKALETFLHQSPSALHQPAGPRNWPPLLYLCYSRYLRLQPQRQADFLRCAKLLIQSGADPNTHFVHEGFNETALFGVSGVANSPLLTRYLLQSGADPDDLQSAGQGTESLYHACEHLDNECLRLLLKAGPRKQNMSYCLARKLDFDDIQGVRLMLDYGADPNQGALPHAIRRGRSVEIITLLIQNGADVNRPDKTGMAPLHLARRLGRTDIAELLLQHGATDDASPREQFLAACAAGNTRLARKFLKDEPGLVKKLSPDELHILPDAAWAGHQKAVRLMLDLGFDINAKGDWGGSAIQQAAGHGHLALTKLLISRGADLKLKNKYGGNALGAATHFAQETKHPSSRLIISALKRAMSQD